MEIRIEKEIRRVVRERGLPTPIHTKQWCGEFGIGEAQKDDFNKEGTRAVLTALRREGIMCTGTWRDTGLTIRGALSGVTVERDFFAHTGTMWGRDGSPWCRDRKATPGETERWQYLFRAIATSLKRLDAAHRCWLRERGVLTKHSPWHYIWPVGQRYWRYAERVPGQLLVAGNLYTIDEIKAICA